jgi:hypothetical protein
MRAYVFVGDSNDEQATIPHETDTGELRALKKKTCRFDPVHS